MSVAGDEASVEVVVLVEAGASVAAWVGSTVSGGVVAGAPQPTKTKTANNTIVKAVRNIPALLMVCVLYLGKMNFKSFGLGI